MNDIYYGKAGDLSPFLVHDRLFIGEALIETLRVHQGFPRHPEAHFNRLSQSAKQLAMPFSLTYDAFYAGLMSAISQFGQDIQGLKLMLSGGVSQRGLLQEGQEARILITPIMTKPNPAPMAIMPAPWFRDANNPIYQLKSMDYLEAIIARRHAVSLGFDDVVFLNQSGHVTETSISNIGMIKNNVVYTPSESAGVLKGVAIGVIQHACQALEMGFEFGHFSVEDFLAADVVFTCNALQGVLPVFRWGEHHWPLQGSIVRPVSLLADFL